MTFMTKIEELRYSLSSKNDYINFKFIFGIKNIPEIISFYPSKII